MVTYEKPTITLLGTVQEMTEAKCDGSGDAVFPQLHPDPNSPSCP